VQITLRASKFERFRFSSKNSVWPSSNCHCKKKSCCGTSTTSRPAPSCGSSSLAVIHNVARRARSYSTVEYVGRILSSTRAADVAMTRPRYSRSATRLRLGTTSLRLFSSLTHTLRRAAADNPVHQLFFQFRIDFSLSAAIKRRRGHASNLAAVFNRSATLSSSYLSPDSFPLTPA